MELTISKELLGALGQANATHPMVNSKMTRYGGDIVFSAFSVSHKYLRAVQEHCAKDQKTHSKLLQKLSQFFTVVREGQAMSPKRLDTLESALTNLIIQTSKNRWLWSADELLPYVVQSIHYKPSAKDDPASVSVMMRYTARGETKSRGVTFYQSDIQSNRTLAKLLLDKGLIVETPELVEQYEVRLSDWAEIYEAHYKQFILTTDNLNRDANAGYDSWSSRSRLVEQANSCGEFKVVNDVPQAKLGTQVDYISVKSMPLLADVDDEEAEEIAEDFNVEGVTNFPVPRHLFVLVFNLETHTHMWVKSDQLKPYEFNEKLVEKLLLPKRHKTLIDLLTRDPASLSADIVAGKSAGTIVLCHGEPGLGKTLTAEAFSEATSRILYKVQSDQLGITPVKLEENLREIFARAQRWGAVLVIDEVDIYVHERGLDIVQNAIVGTLLRTLEYFSGIIFMTTNRDLIIDDAILSRCSAVIAYDYPDDVNAEKLYAMFSELFGMTLSVEVVREFRATHPRLSGRTIKNVLRLAAQRGQRAPTCQDLLDTKEFVIQQFRSASSK